MRNHLGVAQDRRAGGERRTGSFDKPFRKNKVLGCLDLTAGMDHADRDLGLLFREARQVGLGADDGEGALIDRVAVLDVVVFAHCGPSTNACARRATPSRVAQAAALSPGFLLTEMSA